MAFFNCLHLEVEITNDLEAIYVVDERRLMHLYLIHTLENLGKI